MSEYFCSLQWMVESGLDRFASCPSVQSCISNYIQYSILYWFWQQQKTVKPLDARDVRNLCVHHQYPTSDRVGGGMMSFAPLIIQQAPSKFICHREREIRLLHSSPRGVRIAWGGWPGSYAMNGCDCPFLRAGLGQVEQVPSHSTQLKSNSSGQRVQKNLDKVTQSLLLFQGGVATIWTS